MNSDIIGLMLDLKCLSVFGVRYEPGKHKNKAKKNIP